MCKIINRESVLTFLAPMRGRIGAEGVALNLYGSTPLPKQVQKAKNILNQLVRDGEVKCEDTPTEVVYSKG